MQPRQVVARAELLAPLGLDLVRITLAVLGGVVVLVALVALVVQALQERLVQQALQELVQQVVVRAELVGLHR